MGFFQFKHIVKIVVLAVVLAFASNAYANSIRVKVGNAKKYRLNAKPNVVVIGNPDVADVIIEDNRVMFVIGLSVGQTSLHILDSKGTTLMRRHISVSAPSYGHITVQRGMNATEMTCQAGRCYNRPGYRVRSMRVTGGGGGGGFTRNNNVGGPGGDTSERNGNLQ